MTDPNAAADQLRTIQARLDRVESEARTARRLAGALALVAIGGVALAATEAFEPSPLLQTQRLEILDDAGTPVLSLAADEHGGTFFLRNAAGGEAVEFFVDPQGSGVARVNDDTGQHRVRLSGGAGDLELATAAGATVATLGVTHDAGRLHIDHAEGHTLVKLGGTGAQSGYATFHDDMGQPRATIGATETRSGTISLWNAQGLPIIDAYADTSDRGVLRVADHEGAGRVTLQADADGGAMYLVNRFNRPIFEVYAQSTGSGVLTVSDAKRTPRVRLAGLEGAGVIELFDAAASDAPARTVAPE